MPRRPIIWPYTMGSRSSRDLARALNTIRVYPNRRYHPRPNHLIINWGNSNLPRWWPEVRRDEVYEGFLELSRHIPVLNKPGLVGAASDKLSAFHLFTEAEVAAPEFTTDPEIAAGWDSSVVVRHVLRGHAGVGVEIIPAGQGIPTAPLYTRYLGWRKEYRVHVWGGEVIKTQRKVLPLDRDRSQDNWEIRTHPNGWIYIQQNDEEQLSTVAVQAVAALGLDFGAVDICTKRRGDSRKVYVLEVNTAPGLEGQTLTAYVNAIERQL